MKTVVWLLFVMVMMLPGQLSAQNFRADYKSGPVHYQPDDPWVRGKIFQVHTGHGGFFYNCDHQEDKRFSPYINWNRQPKWCYPRRPILCDIRRQKWEVKRRICWGKGNCCHKSDRLPPRSDYVHPVAEDYSTYPASDQELVEPIPMNNYSKKASDSKTRTARAIIFSSSKRESQPSDFLVPTPNVRYRGNK